ncbi:hypothetical protein ACPW7O_33340, partial [Streptomyces tunisiensis]
MREFSHRRLETLVSNGHLSTVFTPAGQPYYTTPERFDELSPRWLRRWAARISASKSGCCRDAEGSSAS